jgi:hypothetical protein
MLGLFKHFLKRGKIVAMCWWQNTQCFVFYSFLQPKQLIPSWGGSCVPHVQWVLQTGDVFSTLVNVFSRHHPPLNCTHANHYLIQVASPHSPSKGTHSGIDHIQATRRPVSSWVGDHQRIPAVVCFFPFYSSFNQADWPCMVANLYFLMWYLPCGSCGCGCGWRPSTRPSVV